MYDPLGNGPDMDIAEINVPAFISAISDRRRVRVGAAIKPFSF